MRRHRSFDEEASEAILSGKTPGSDPELAAFVNDVRSVFADAPAPQRSPELSAFMSAPLLDAPAPEAVPWRDRINRRKARMLSGVATFVGTLTGKVVLGGAVAAASVGGLHAADVVDVPGLPRNDPPAVEEHDGEAKGDEELPEEAVAGQQTAEEKKAAAKAYTDAVREWTDCVSQNAADRGDTQSDESTRTTEAFDPREGCEPRPQPENFGLTEAPDQASDEGRENSENRGGSEGVPEGTPGEENVPDDPASQGDDGSSNAPEGTPTSPPETTPPTGDPTGNSDQGQSNRP